MEKVHRKDVAQKRNQGVWSVYEGVEWDGKIFKVGQLVRFSAVFAPFLPFHQQLHDIQRFTQNIKIGLKVLC